VWWTGLTVADAKRALSWAQPSLERMVVDGTEMWMSNALTQRNDDVPRAHLLPGFDEFMLGYRDRSAALASRHAERVVPGGNGVFLSTLVLDGQVCGTWRRTTRPKSVEIEALPFGRLKATDKKEFAGSVERFANFLGAPVNLTWSS
jgi:hypothetical protein